MFQYLLRRLFASIIMIFVAGTIVFFIIHLLPGDPVMLLLGDAATEDVVIEKMRQKLKLDLPIAVQYYQWVKGLVQLDLGQSIQTDLPVTTELFRRIPRSLELILAALLLSALTGVAAFEWISPISMLHRELIFGIGLGLTAVLGVFLFDLFILRNGWCGHLCPLGAFYAVVGRVAQLRVRFDTPTCTHCGECARVCPEPQVLNLREASEAGMVASGECTNCGRCITICPEDTLHFDLRRLINTDDNETATNEPHSRRAA